MAGCAQKPLPQAAPLPPNPFGYLKRAAVCDTTPAVDGPGGRVATMKVRSDDGLCSLMVQQPDGTSYASFVLTDAPAHGKAFLYNWNNETVVSYTPTTAYAGADSFTVGLIPGSGRPRQLLRVTATVDATGVRLPVVAAPPPPPASTSKSKTSTSKHRTTRHKKSSKSSS